MLAELGMSNLRPYRTTEEEFAHLSTVVPPYVPPHAQPHYGLPTKYPNPIDRYRIDYWRPTVEPLQIDVEALRERATQGWKRCGWDVKRKWAFRPSVNYRPFDWASANGHPSGKVGVCGELITEEMDPNLGGGQMALLCHLPAISKL